MANNYQVTKNDERSRYEIHLDGHTAFAEYKVKANKIYLVHTEVPKELGGRGVGSSLVKHALEDIEKQGKKVVPVCSFVAAYTDRHPEWKKLLG